MKLSVRHITQLLTQNKKLNLPAENPYSWLRSNDKSFAAVLIPLIWQGNDWNLLFIRRSQKKSDHHSGQVAFPGGHCIPKDKNARTTALRETQEEIGVDPEDIQILGQLRAIVTITNIQVTPVVGVIPWPYVFIPQPEEVFRIFTIPLSWLANPNNRRIKHHVIQLHDQSIPVIHFNRYDNEVLWGASARITLSLLEALELSALELRYRG